MRDNGKKSKFGGGAKHLMRIQLSGYQLIPKILQNFQFSSVSIFSSLYNCAPVSYTHASSVKNVVTLSSNCLTVHRSQSFVVGGSNKGNNHAYLFYKCIRDVELRLINYMVHVGLWDLCHRPFWTKFE
jgi:hypothetical protein